MSCFNFERDWTKSRLRCCNQLLDVFKVLRNITNSKCVDVSRDYMRSYIYLHFVRRMPMDSSVQLSNWSEIQQAIETNWNFVTSCKLSTKRAQIAFKSFDPLLILNLNIWNYLFLTHTHSLSPCFSMCFKCSHNFSIDSKHKMILLLFAITHCKR